MNFLLKLKRSVEIREIHWYGAVLGFSMLTVQ